MELLTRLWSCLSDAPFRFRGPGYHRFRKIIIPASRGTTEIDHLVVSRLGILVVALTYRSG